MSETKQQDPVYLHPGGRYWRAVATLLFFQALCWGGGAALAWLILSPELAKDYFSAHHTVKATSRLVVPGLAFSAGVGFLVAGVGSALSLWSYSRRLLASLRPVDEVIRALGAGRFPAPGAGPAPVAAAATTLEPLRAHVLELQRHVGELQKVSLELNYRSAGTGEVTLKDLRAIAAQLEALAKALSRSAVWFAP
ncbi:MAG TPA: hypothetical protein VN317_02795 [Candidatus Methanoperedens sp.]|nr:hypothetical protein [Candidatus Methanoperedens sp.]